MKEKNLIRFILTFFLGWIGSLIINYTELKPEGYKSNTLLYFILGLITFDIGAMILALFNLKFDPNNEKNIGYSKD